MEGGRKGSRQEGHERCQEGRNEGRKERWMDRWGKTSKQQNCQKLLLFSSHTTKLAFIHKPHPCIAMAQVCERSYLEECAAQYSTRWTKAEKYKIKKQTQQISAEKIPTDPLGHTRISCLHLKS
jgi:hypothetical protein